MATITNQSQTTYQFDGSSEVLTTSSNINEVTLEENQGLILTKTASPTTFVAGSIITYTVTITNSSSSFLTGVRIIDNLGANNLAYVLGSARLTAGSVTYPVNPVATTPLTFTLQQLNVGASMTLTYRAQVINNLPTTVDTINNSIEGIGYTSTGTITGFASSSINRTGTGSNFVATKTASVETTYPNRLFSYTIRLTNNNTANATAIETTDQLPANFVITSITLKIGAGSTITLLGTDYTLSGTNLLTIPSASGPLVSVPSENETIITINGYFE